MPSEFNLPACIDRAGSESCPTNSALTCNSKCIADVSRSDATETGTLHAISPVFHSNLVKKMGKLGSWWPSRLNLTPVEKFHFQGSTSGFGDFLAYTSE